MSDGKPLPDGERHGDYGHVCSERCPVGASAIWSGSDGKPATGPRPYCCSYCKLPPDECACEYDECVFHDCRPSDHDCPPDPSRAEHRPEGCTCGEHWPCPLHGGPPEADPSRAEPQQQSESISSRYEQMPSAPWFREAHEGKSLGESTRVSGGPPQEPMRGEQIVREYFGIAAGAYGALAREIDAALATRDTEWITRLGLTSRSMDAAINSLHNVEVDRSERIRGLEAERDALRAEVETLQDALAALRDILKHNLERAETAEAHLAVHRNRRLG